MNQLSALLHITIDDFKFSHYAVMAVFEGNSAAVIYNTYIAFITN